MHELSISSAVIETALKHAGGRKVTAVHLRVGRLRQVVPDSLAFYLEIVGRDTACADARLELEVVEALMACDCCGQEWDPEPAEEPSLHPGLGSMPVLPQFRCPACEGTGARVLRGEELEVESIDVEDDTFVAAGPPNGRGPDPD